MIIEDVHERLYTRAEMDVCNAERTLQAFPAGPLAF